MKLTNVHYEYRGNDIWRIYFKNYKEEEDFENERTDGKKPTCRAIFTNSLEIRCYIEAELVGRFSILRHCVKTSTNGYFSNDIWRALVKKIEGADSDYIFDEIDLWYDTTTDKCYFKICCMNGTWTDLFVKNMLNSQFGMVAQANGYSDTDTVGEGGLCTRRSCCGIGFHPNMYKTSKERIMFSVKDHCSNGKADIIKVGAWTSTFIGTNKEDEKEYLWRDFKKYMGLLHANGSDIWDIEWKYDAACPLTGTEIADELHLYLKPGAYKRLFEEKPKQLLKNITDISSPVTKVIGCSILHYYNLYFDDKSDLVHARLNEKNKNLITATIIWWSDGTKTVVKCQKGDKMDPEKGIAMCVMKKFMGTNETHSNYLDFAKDAIKDYEAKQKAMAAARKKAADKKRRAAKKEEKGNGEA